MKKIIISLGLLFTVLTQASELQELGYHVPVLKCAFEKTTFENYEFVLTWDRVLGNRFYRQQELAKKNPLMTELSTLVSGSAILSYSGLLQQVTPGFKFQVRAKLNYDFLHPELQVTVKGNNLFQEVLAPTEMTFSLPMKNSTKLKLKSKNRDYWVYCHQVE